MVAPRPTYEAWKEWSAAEFGGFSPSQKAYYQAEVFDLIRPIKSADILEVGFGNGCFLGCAQALGHRVIGVELNGVLRDRAAAMGVVAHENIDELQAASFDAVVAMDVLEHVPDAYSVELVLSMMRVLRPGGLVVLRFPNGDSPFGRAHQYGDMTHVSVVGSIKMNYIARCVGLEVIAMRNEALVAKGLPIHRRLKLLVRVGSRFLIEWLLGVTFFGTRRPLGQNLVVTLRKPLP